jgi:ABC-type nitrate/sulfonate/bicarbonate transport system ATPase subunit
MEKILDVYSQQETEYRSSDRWYPTFRKPIYISFKYQFSAFDRAFHINNTSLTLVERIDKIKKSAKRLDVVVSKGSPSYKPGGVEAVFSNRLLTQDEIAWVNYILGKNYTEARYIEHRLYEKERGTSVIFQTAADKYSEAFAGSGELAVVNLVIKLMNGNQYDLVLLDEPETSLHPGAQENLVKFLMWCVQCKKYQILLSTHSPTIAQLLPKDALFALLETDQGRTAISSVEHPHMAFSRIGHVPENKKLVIVEDNLLLKLVEVALDRLEDWKKESLELHLPASGGDEVFKYLVPIHHRENRDVHYILDGDKVARTDLDLATISMLEAPAIYQKIKTAYNCEPLHLDKNNKQDCLDYINKVQQRVHYLSATCPEIVFLELIQEEEVSNLSNEEAKKKLVKTLDTRKLGSTASEQHILFNLYLRQSVDNTYISDLAKTLDAISLGE